MVNDAFNAVASTVGKAQRMYEQYNTAMIRVAQLQENVTLAQQKYNDAVTKFGPQSSQATAALRELEKAQKDLALAQQQNTMMLLGFAAQIPSFIGNLDKIRVSFALLKAQIEMTHLSLKALAATISLYAIVLVTAAAAIQAHNQFVEQMQKSYQLTYREMGLLTMKAKQMGITVYELIDAIRAGTVSIAKFGDEYAVIEKKLRGLTGATVDNVKVILDQYRATKQQQDAVKAATEAYAQGKISIEEFTRRLLELRLTGDEVLRTLMNTVVQVPKTFEEQLVGKSQAILENFKQCAGGKFFDIRNNTAKNFQELVTSTNTLIKNGLLGQAQENIAAFVQCSTNKQKTMVQQIDGYLKQLQNEYEENAAKIIELTKKGATDEVKIYEERNKQIMALIKQLEDWKRLVLQTPWISAPPPGTPYTPPTFVDICPYCGWNEGHAPGCPLAPYVRMQRGGIVTKPTLALLGEGYKKEAVIPLDKAGGAGPTVWRIEVNVSGASSDQRGLARQIAREIVSATEGRRRV